MCFTTQDGRWSDRVQYQRPLIAVTVAGGTFVRDDRQSDGPHTFLKFNRLIVRSTRGSAAAMSDRSVHNRSDSSIGTHQLLSFTHICCSKLADNSSWIGHVDRKATQSVDPICVMLANTTDAEDQQSDCKACARVGCKNKRVCPDGSDDRLHSSGCVIMAWCNLKLADILVRGRSYVRTTAR